MKYLRKEHFWQREQHSKGQEARRMFGILKQYQGGQCGGNPEEERKPHGSGDFSFHLTSGQTGTSKLQLTPKPMCIPYTQWFITIALYILTEDGTKALKNICFQKHFIQIYWFPSPIFQPAQGKKDNRLEAYI